MVRGAKKCPPHRLLRDSMGAAKQYTVVVVVVVTMMMSDNKDDKL